MPPVVPRKQTPAPANGPAAKKVGLTAAPAPPPSTSVLDRIVPISFEEAGLKVLIYGRSSTGKTTFWGSFPGETLAVICSGSDQPGELRSINTPEHRNRIKTVTLQSVEELADIIDHVRGTGRYKNVVLDHASGFGDLSLASVLGIAPGQLAVQKKRGVATQQQFGEATGLIKDALRAFINLPCNVIIIAQERNFNEGGDGEMILPNVGADMMPSVTRWLNTAVDYIVNTFIRQKTAIQKIPIGPGKFAETVVNVPGKVEYCLRTAPNPVYTTKFRIPKGSVELPDVLVDPTYESFMALLKRATGQ